MANESFELYSLTSKLTLDTSQFDRGYHQSHAKFTTLSQDLKRVETGGKSLGTAFGGLQSAISGLGGPLDGIIGRYSSMLSVGGQLTLSSAGLGTGLGIVAAGAAAAAVGVFTLAKQAADAGDEIFDLTQKVNFSAESISTLKNEGELAGVEFQSISASLGIFNKNVDAAQSGNKELAKTFKGLKIDLSDNETALRSSFKALLAVEDGNQQAALAMKIFGKSGKEILGIIHSMNGDIDAATEKFRSMNSLITTESAKAANDFSDKLKLLQQRIDGLTRTVGEELIPVVERALDDFAVWLQNNQGELRKTAQELAVVVGWVYRLSKAIIDSNPNIIFIRVVRSVTDFSGGGANKEQQEGLSFDANTLTGVRAPQRYEAEGEFAVAGGAGQYSIGAGPLATKRGGRINLGGGGKGGGTDPAKIAEQMAKLQLDAALAGLKAEQEANKRALELRRKDFNEYANQYMVIENRRHNAVIAGLDAEQKAAEKLKKGKDIALLEIENKRAEERTKHEQNRNAVLDERGKILDQIDNFLRDQDREINSLTNSTNQWDDAYQQLVDTLKAEGVTLEKNTRLRIQGNIARAKELELVLSVTRARRVADSTRDRTVTKEARERPDWIDLGGGSTVGGEPATTGRPRIATVEEQVKRERAAILREQMDDLARDLTWTIDDAITEGFRRGVKAGVIEFGLGILQMAQHAALKKLEEALSKVLGGSGGQNTGGGGGSGLFSTIINLGLSAIGGLFGGSSVGGVGGASAGTIIAAGGMGIGGHAGGGYMSPDSWSWVGERGPELVKAGPRGTSVISAGESMALAGGGGLTVVQNIHVPSMYQAGNRQTQTQALRGLQQAAQRGYTLRG